MQRDGTESANSFVDHCYNMQKRRSSRPALLHAVGSSPSPLICSASSIVPPQSTVLE